MRSSLSVDWVGLATSRRSPGEVLVRLQPDFVGAKRRSAQGCAPDGGMPGKRLDAGNTSGATNARRVTVAEHAVAPRLASSSKLPRGRTT